MAFDPDAYLAVFDPDAYLGEQKEEPSYKNLAKLPKEALGFIEAPLSMVTGLGSSIVGGLAGVLGGGTLDERSKRIQDIQESGTYTPRTDVGQTIIKAAAAPFELASKGYGEIGNLVAGDAGRAIGETGSQMAMAALGTPSLVRGGAKVGSSALKVVEGKMTSRAAAKNSAQIERSQQLQRVGEAAQFAKDLKIAINPEDANPTLLNAVRSGVARSDVLDQTLAMKNKSQWTNIAKNELGIDESIPLNKASINEVIERAASANKDIAGIASLTDDAGAIVKRLGALKVPAIEGFEATSNSVNGMLNDLSARVRGGMDGAQALERIRQYRKVSGKSFNRDNLTEVELARAEAFKGAANALEGLIEDNLTRAGNAELLNTFRTNRTAMAKAYAYKNATDFGRQLVDPLKIAKIVKGDNAFTGDIQKIGVIASEFPKVAKLPDKIVQTAPERISRATLPASIGAGVGAIFGGPAGAGAGGLIGAGVGELMGMAARRRIASQGFQQSGATIPNVSELYTPIQTATRRIPINQDIPYEGLPNVGYPVVPGSWKGMLTTEKPSPLPALAEDLLPVAERYAGTDIPIGRVEGGIQPVNTPLPTIPPVERGMLSLADDYVAPKKSAPVETIDFPLRQEVLQQPAIRSAVTKFVSEAERLRELIQTSQGFWKDRYRAQLATLEDEFAAGMKQLGIRNPQEALGLQKLYEGGGNLRRQVQR